MDPKEGRRPKAAAPLLGAAGGRDNIIVNKIVFPLSKNAILTFFDDFETPQGRFFEDFPRVLRNRRFLILLLFLIIPQK